MDEKSLFPNIPKHKMTSFDSYNAKTTSISYPWPREVNGIERIALSAQGDLQRVLSAFFARPIVIALVYSHTSRQVSPTSSSYEPIHQVTPAIIASAAPDAPIVQTRQVHLQCNGRIVCTATSTVKITSPSTAHLFLQEKYAIGQMFRRMEKVPAFELIKVGLGEVDRDGASAINEKSSSAAASFATTADKVGNQLWRRYTLTVPHFECEILEVFPAREMFTAGERWLTADPSSVPELGSSVNGYGSAATALTHNGNGNGVLHQGIKIVVAVGVLLMLLFEALMHLGGKSRYC
ncbi:hypothetical protein BDN70DRAFT_874799 [Pholiota conissans]|uniref:Uncharacterized protein n=1 Tax=Pholiota conissans TaxID=109636 RepID=A0A9P6D408_9AGAR|nr:hypothetical protein BDN70DRAFT_874799 [Pholiota conissans]